MIWFADFETKKINEEEIRVSFGYVESLEKNQSLFFTKIKDFFDFVSSFSKETQTIYFHNLSYDGEFIVWWLIENNFEPFKNKLEHSNSFKEKTDFYGAKSEIYVNYKGKKIRILCSYKLWPVKLEEIGKSLKFPKLNVDLSQIDFYENSSQIPKELKRYCERDVQIIKMKYQKYSKFYPIKKTASSSSWKYFQNWWENKYSKQDFKYKFSISEHWHKHLSFAYWGGLNGVNEKIIGQHLKGIFNVYDLNSSYSTIFVEELLPYGTPHLIKPEGDYVEIVEAIICKIKKKNPNMISHLHNWIKHNKRQEHYIDEYEDSMSVMYSKQEWDEICKTYDFEIIEKQSIYFKASRQLGEYIEELYHFKENEKDPVTRNDHKQILNTFTGKWGQSIYQTSRFLRKATEEDSRKYHYGNFVYETYTEKTKEIKYVPIAIFVTSLARVKLIQTIRDNLKYFLYSDTDSVILLDSKSGYAKIKVDDSKLGYWKQEAIGVEIKILKPKCYILKLVDGNFKKVLAGINKECHNLFNFENFFIGSKIENGNLKKRKLKGGFELMYEDIVI